MTKLQAISDGLEKQIRSEHPGIGNRLIVQAIDPFSAALAEPKAEVKAEVKAFEAGQKVLVCAENYIAPQPVWRVTKITRQGRVMCILDRDEIQVARSYLPTDLRPCSWADDDDS